ncbi:MAG: sigma 54-interacting transcriptional regulator, partial [Deltaproteobacteria bacterium]|nr:sigma 54-interacting transcriptional regulator [Deltaproteobacteria bacterium]
LAAAELELNQRGFLETRNSADEGPRLAQESLRTAFQRNLKHKLLQWAHARWLDLCLRQAGTTPRPTEAAVAIAEHALQAQDGPTALAWGFAAAGVLTAQGKDPEAISVYERLWHLARTDEHRYQIQGHLAPIFYRMGKLSEALQAYDRWIAHRPDDPSRLQRAKHRFYSGLVLFGMERKAEAKKHFEDCLSVADAELHPAHRPYQARAHNFLAAMEQDRGKPGIAEEHLKMALQLAAGDELMLGETEQRWGELERSLLHLTPALAHLGRALGHYRAAKNPQAEAVALHWQATLWREAGRLDEAETALEGALELTAKAGNLLQWARYRHNFALLAMDRADYAAGLARMDDAREILFALGTEPDRYLAQLHRAELLSRAGNRDAGEKLFQELEEARTSLRDLGLERELDLRLGEQAYLDNDFNRAEEFFRDATSHALREESLLQQKNAQLGLSRCRAQIQAGPPPPGEWKNIRTLDDTRIRILDWVFRDLEPNPTASTWAQTLSEVRGLASPEVRAELLQILSAAFRRKGLTATAKTVFQEYLQEQVNILRQLPEEMKMDFEKNRKVQSLDEALNSASASPGSSRIGGTVPAVPETAARPPDHRFRQFTEISRQISKRHELAGILERVMDAAIEITGAERGFLLLRAPDAQGQPLAGFEVGAARHLSHQSIQREEFKISMTAVRQAMEQGSTLLTGDAQLDPRLQEKKSVVQFQLKSILVVPLEVEGRVKGAVYLDHRYQPGCFRDEDVATLNALASQASLAIEKAEMIEELRQAKRKLEERVEHQEKRIEDLSDELSHVREQLRYGYEEIVGRSPPMMEVFHLLDHVTDTPIPVWIHGESGTGKELIARSLHFNSQRKPKAFLAVNCSAIPENLLESELFGHKKGSFTHADRDRIGLFEQASGGTLFLDEVADMSLAMQVKLLRVLQDSEVRPIGATKSVKVDVRLVTASNKDLEKMVEEEKFRQDLFFRINGLTIRLPPLRERREDIPLLINHLMEKISRDFQLPACEVGDEAFERLIQHPWPGNIRQLEGVLRNALLFAKGRTITPAFLSLGKTTGDNLTGASAQNPSIGNERREERQLIVEALRKARMDKQAAADQLGISLRSLYMRMERHRIPKNKAVLAKFLGLKTNSAE